MTKEQVGRRCCCLIIFFDPWLTAITIIKDGGVYWGMTKDFARRVGEHGDRFVSITEEYRAIGTKGAARGLEQMKITAAGGVKYLENSINSVRGNNPRLHQYLTEAVNYLNSLKK